MNAGWEEQFHFADRHRITDSSRTDRSASTMTSVIDNDMKSLAEVAVDPEGSIVFAKDANGAAFTASGTKGLPAATGISYHL